MDLRQCPDKTQIVLITASPSYTYWLFYKMFNNNRHRRLMRGLFDINLVSAIFIRFLFKLDGPDLEQD